MALISMRQMLDHAAEYGYGIPAFNVNNLEQMRAIMEAADILFSFPSSTFPLQLSIFSFPSSAFPV